MGEVLESETDVALKTFLRHFWIAREGDVKAQSLYREIRDKIETDNIDSLGFSRELRDASIVYREILNANLEDQELDQTLEHIAEVGAVAAYPALLAATLAIQDRAALRPLARALLVAYVRHTVIGRLENALLENAFYGVAKSLHDQHDVTAAVQNLIGFAPNDDAFRNAFRSAILPYRGVARYVLREIELLRRATEELDVALPPRVHVEHIYPQKPPEGQRWQNHQAMINRIGNLSLLSRRLNTAIKNAPYDQKRPVYLQSEIVLTNQLPELEAWSPEAIQNRQDGMADDAFHIWPFPPVEQ